MTTEAQRIGKYTDAELRDRFAMAALTGILSATYNEIHRQYTDIQAEFCYQMADAILKERNKT